MDAEILSQLEILNHMIAHFLPFIAGLIVGLIVSATVKV